MSFKMLPVSILRRCCIYRSNNLKQVIIKPCTGQHLSKKTPHRYIWWEPYFIINIIHYRYRYLYFMQFSWNVVNGKYTRKLFTIAKYYIRNFKSLNQHNCPTLVDTLSRQPRFPLAPPLYACMANDVDVTQSWNQTLESGTMYRHTYR